MNFAQPVPNHTLCQPQPIQLPILFQSSGKTRRPETDRQRQDRLTPISAFPAEILARVRHEDHGQDELELLQGLLPFPLGVGLGLVGGGGVDVVAGGGVREGVEVVGGGGAGRVDVLGQGGWGGHGGLGLGQDVWRRLVLLGYEWAEVGSN